MRAALRRLRVSPEREEGRGGLLGLTLRTVAWKAGSAAAVGVAGVVTARQLGPEGRGIVALYVAVATATMLVSSLGVDASGRLALARPEDPLDLRDYLGLCTVLLAAHVILCAALAAVLLPLVEVDVGLGGAALLALLGGGFLAQSLLNEATNAYGLVSNAAAIEAAGGVLQLLAVGALVVGDVRTAGPFVGVLAGASLFQVGVALSVLRGTGRRLRPRYVPAAWRSFVRVGMGGLLVNLGQGLSFRIDRYLVGLFLTPSAVGVYAVASTPTEVLRLPGLALGEVVYHRLASQTASVDDLRRYRRLFLLVTGGLAALFFAVAPVAVPAIFGADFEPAVTPLRILLLAEVGIAFYQLDSAALFGLGHIADVALASIAGLVLVVVADIVLINAYGVAGAAWASVAAYSAMGAITYGRARALGLSRVAERPG